MAACCTCGSICVSVTHSGAPVASSTVTVLAEGTGTSGTSCTASGAVTNIVVNNQGSGYTGVPNVTLSGGSPSVAATATAHLTSGKVSSITFTPGSGYSAVPTAAIDAPPAIVTATATATVSGGSVTGFTITNPGSGYTTSATVTLSGGGFSSPASGTAAISGGVVTAINVVNPGAGYTGAPTVTISAPPTAVNAIATVTAAATCCIAITKAGNYLITATGSGTPQQKVLAATCITNNTSIAV